jgi:hypothetical protein
MIALFASLILTASAQAAAPAFTVDEVIARFSVDLAKQCDFEAEDIADRLKNASVYTVETKGETSPTTYQIFELACSHGAYNFNSVYYVGSEYAGLELVQFVEPLVANKTYKVTGYSTVNMVTNSGFEPKNSTLGFFAKGRGLGDCFTSGSYKFEGGRFVLKTYEVDGECDGKIKPRKIVNLK